MSNPNVGECDAIFKVICIGDSGVGKSSLTIRLSEDVFFADYASTIAIDFRMCSMNFKGKKVKLQIWDTAGQERFLAVSTSFYRGANGVLLCFDLTNRQSFEHANAWLERVKMQAMPNVPIVLVGCKADDTRNRVVNQEEAAAYARAHGMGYIESSAKTKDNVEHAFEEITSRMMEDAKTRGKSAVTGGQPGSVSLAPAPGRPGAGGPGSRRGDTNNSNDSGCPC